MPFTEEPQYPANGPYADTGVGPPTRRSMPRNSPAQAPPQHQQPQQQQRQNNRYTNSPNDYYEEDPVYDDYENNPDEGERAQEDDEEEEYHREPFVDDGDDEQRQVYHDGDDPPPEQPRQWKYSSANMKQRGNCRKYCCIALLFLVFLAFSIGISILIDKLFFSEDSEQTSDEPYVMPPETMFVNPKQIVDVACGSKTFDQDGGAKCKEYCEPQYSTCCMPFSPYEIYDTSGSTTGNENNGVNGTRPEPTPELCPYGDNEQGCYSYAKCIGAVGMDPAEAALPVYCSEPHLSEDRETCEDLCQQHSCCHGQPEYGTVHCLADKFDVCLDYAPCQNLREGPKLVPAPVNLDELCFHDHPDCEQACKEAECCNVNHTQSCFQKNFISCLTYAACSFSNYTKTNITVAPRFAVLPLVPKELDSACDERKDTTVETTELTCEEYCKTADCCYHPNPEMNCFNKDPLGCLAWDQQCQINRIVPPS